MSGVDLIHCLYELLVQAISQGNNQEAVAYMQRCTEMLPRLPKDVTRALCYHHNSITMYCCPVHIAVGGVGDVHCERVLSSPRRPRTSPSCATTLEWKRTM